MAVLNASLPGILDPISSTVGTVLNLLQVLVGGLFGLYLVLIYLRWREARDLKRLMTEMRDDIRKLNLNIEKWTSSKKR